MNIPLARLAHSRAGDKGDVSNLSLIAWRAGDFATLAVQMTPERVRAHFHWLPLTRVDQYLLPDLAAINLVMHGALHGGVTRALAQDAHGKTLAGIPLELEIEVEP